MINGADFLHEKNHKKLIKKFYKEKFSKISIIRIAAHLRDIDKLIPYIKILKNYGYKMILNLMQIDRVTNRELKKTLATLEKLMQ